MKATSSSASSTIWRNRATRLLPRVNLLLDDTLADRCDEICEQVEVAQDVARFLHQHGAKLTKLE